MRGSLFENCLDFLVPKSFANIGEGTWVVRLLPALVDCNGGG